MKVALIHDWLTGMRGGERVLEVFCELFPQADLYTLIHHEGSLSPTIEKMSIVQSSLPKWPIARNHFRLYLPIFPRLIESFDFSGYDLVLSSSHCVAKGARTGEETLHICYCHTPMRYVWDMYEEYMRERSLLERLFLKLNRGHLQKWDRQSAGRVDEYLANSNHVADRIRRHYQREATIVHPPVDAAYFTPGAGVQEEYYLIVSALVPYKRVGMAVRAFSDSGKPLVVIGTGSDADRIRNEAGPNVRFLGNVEDPELREWYRGARALVFPGEEDFGITPLESMACGRPVIAYGRGGATESVVSGETGLFFEEQSPRGIIAAVDKFEGMQFISDQCRKRALEFERPLFKNKIQEIIEKQLQAFHEVRSGAQRS